MEKTFSLNGEEYYDDVDYIKDMIEDHKTVFVADQEKKHHKNYIDINDLLESMADRAYDDAPEWCSNYVDQLNKPTIAQKSCLEHVNLNYMDKHFEQPDFYHAVNVIEIPVEQFKKEYC